jgi:transposase
MANEAGGLFPDLPLPPRREEAPVVQGSPRVLMPNRLQMQLRPSDLESLLPADHPARLVWGFVTRQDLSRLYAKIKAVEGGPGRDAIAPEILLSLWLYATLNAVGSARALASLCEAHDAYRWLCGGVRVNHHTLSDFRVGHEAFLDGLLTSSVASLVSAGAVTLLRVAQDGMRVRASAGSSSFRRKGRLRELRGLAHTQVQRLKRELQDDPGATERRQAAARERAAREREQRIAQALERMPEMEELKEAKGRPTDTARVSTTDPEATVMKMADGGFRPAYNVQFATDTASQVVVGVDVTTKGSDYGEMPVMLDQLARRYATVPQEMLVDGASPGSMPSKARSARVPRSTGRCRNRRTRTEIAMSRARATAPPSPRGEPAWAPNRARRSRRSVPPRLNASTPSPATAACSSCRYGDETRSCPLPCCSR